MTDSKASVSQGDRLRRSRMKAISFECFYGPRYTFTCRHPDHDAQPPVPQTTVEDVPSTGVPPLSGTILRHEVLRPPSTLSPSPPPCELPTTHTSPLDRSEP